MTSGIECCYLYVFSVVVLLKFKIAAVYLREYIFNNTGLPASHLLTKKLCVAISYVMLSDSLRDVVS